MEHITRRNTHVVRLLRIVLELQGGRVPNAIQLARECDVSRRTIFRDLEAIELAGLDVEYDQARRGYRLGGGTAFPAAKLDCGEVVALYLMAQQLATDDDLGLARWSRSGSRKLLYSLTVDQRRRVERIAPGPYGGCAANAKSAPLLDALIHGGDLRLGFDGRCESRATPIDIAPTLLFYEDGWRLLGQEAGRDDAWSFTVNEIAEIETWDGDHSNKRPRRLTDSIVEVASIPAPIVEPMEAVIRLESSRVSTLITNGWPIRSRSARAGEGRVDVTIAVPDAQTLVDWVLGHGDGIEVRWPPLLRRRLREAAQRIVSRYEADEPRVVAIEQEDVKTDRPKQTSARL